MILGLRWQQGPLEVKASLPREHLFIRLTSMHLCVHVICRCWGDLCGGQKPEGTWKDRWVDPQLSGQSWPSFQLTADGQQLQSASCPCPLMLLPPAFPPALHAAGLRWSS